MKKTTLNTINESQHACNELIELLEQENRLLITGKIAEFEDLSEDKSARLQRLKKYEQQLVEIMTAEGAPGTETVNQWERLRNSLSQCRALNQRNGYIINIVLNNIQQSLSILRGNICDNSPTYNNSGATHNPTYTRSIAKI